MESAGLLPPVSESNNPPDNHSEVTVLQRIRRVLSSYPVRKLLQGLFTIWAVMTFTFFLIRQMPGDPVMVEIQRIMTNENLSYEEAVARASGLFNFDPTTPLPQQYLNYVSKVVRGDLGESITSAGTKVTAQIMRYLPWTLFSVGIGLLVSFSLGILVGTAMAFWRGSWFDNLMTTIASIFFSIPNYIIAYMIILILGVQLGVFSVGEMRGAYSDKVEPGFTWAFISSAITHAILPMVTYVTATVGGWMLTMKSSTINTLGEEYVTVARARGLGQWRILTAYVGRNAMLPLVTQLAISIGFVIGGSILIEFIFVYPGIGKFLSDAIGRRDYTSMQGVFLVISIAVVVSNTLADVLYGILDPRIRVVEDQS